MLEAALILPFFISFGLAMNCLIQVSIAEGALQSALSNTTTEIASYMYPVQLLYVEAKQQANQSKVGVLFQEIVDKVEQGRAQVTGAEDIVDQYSGFIPDPLVKVVEWEKMQREGLEKMGQEQYQSFLENTIQPLINEAFTPIVIQYANPKIIHPAQFHVVKITLPALDNKEDCFIGIEARYDLPLPVPFIHKTLHLYKKSYERAWVGK